MADEAVFSIPNFTGGGPAIDYAILLHQNKVTKGYEVAEYGHLRSMFSRDKRQVRRQPCVYC
jgi:hypothetical protein